MPHLLDSRGEAAFWNKRRLYMSLMANGVGGGGGEGYVGGWCMIETRMNGSLGLHAEAAVSTGT